MSIDGWSGKLCIALAIALSLFGMLPTIGWIIAVAGSALLVAMWVADARRRAD